MEPAEWNCCLGNLKFFLCLLRGQGNEAEEIVIEECHCTVIPQKGRCHLATATGYKRGLIKQLRAAWLFKDAILCISDQFYSYISSVGQCGTEVSKVTEELTGLMLQRTWLSIKVISLIIKGKLDGDSSIWEGRDGFAVYGLQKKVFPYKITFCSEAR